MKTKRIRGLKIGCGINEDVLYYGKTGRWSCKKEAAVCGKHRLPYMKMDMVCRQALIASEEGDKHGEKN